MFPGFDPVAFHVGPLAVRWYALAYMVSFIIALPIAKRLCRLSPEVATGEQVDDFLFYAILGVLVGGALVMCCSIGRWIIFRIRWKS